MRVRLRIGAAALAFAAAASMARPASAAGAQTLDAFSDVTPWNAVASDDVLATLSRVESPAGGALRLSFDFRGHAGYAVAHRALALEPPANFEITFRLRGQARPNDFQLKLVDASGDNVWWFRRADYEFSADWKTVRVRSGQIDFAWGPIADHTLRSIAAIEFVVATGSGGGAGAIEVADLQLRPVPPAPAEWPAPVVTSSATDAMVIIDLGVEREFGAVTLRWLEGHVASVYDVQFSDDGSRWTTVREVRNAMGRDQSVYLPESATRFLRLRLNPADERDARLAEVTIEPPAVGASPSQFLSKLARGAPRGAYPRAYVGEQSYWTVVGTDVGRDEGLLSEDAAFELRKRLPSLEPFVRVDGVLYGWANVTAEASLKDRYLPIPSVTWIHDAWQLVTTAFAAGAADREFAVVRYDYENRSSRQQAVTLAIAVRPMQVNPPTQFLNGAGGFAPVRSLDWDGSQLQINREQTVIPLIPPDGFAAANFDLAPRLADLLNAPALADHVSDALGLASGAFLYHRLVPPHGRVTVALFVPWSLDAAQPPDSTHAAAWLRAQEARLAAQWHASLDAVELKGPPEAQPVFDTLRTALAHILINRDGPQ
ncbi:MAG: discoidin domain-containing protein, partial [Steroidobacterales bacterium]